MFWIKTATGFVHGIWFTILAVQKLTMYNGK